MGKIADIQRHFVGAANLIGLHVNGLQGLTIYRDSQFDMEWRHAGFSEELSSIARGAFNREVDERVVRLFPNHPLTKFSIERLTRAEQAAA
jgi:hypothetical protein